MKLAEALVLRSHTQKKFDSLRERIGNNAVVQEGNEPHENPKQLLKEATAVLGEIRELNLMIQETNWKTDLE